MTDDKLFGRLEGRKPIGFEGKRSRARLTDDEVREMRMMRNQGFTLNELAKYFSMAPSSIFQVVERVTYKHVE